MRAASLRARLAGYNLRGLGFKHHVAHIQTMKPEGWDTPFDTPITLPKGQKLKSLRDAGNYMASLPPREHRRAEW